jgi:outer membrane protein TolC
VAPAQDVEPYPGAAEDRQAIDHLSGLPEDAIELTLDDVVSRALRDSFGIRARAHRLAAAQSRLKGSWGPWTPRLRGRWEVRPFGEEEWRTDWEVWERTRGVRGGWGIGVHEELPSGTSVHLGWRQGAADETTLFDPQVYLDNPADPNNPVPLLTDTSFKLRWAQLRFGIGQHLLRGIDPAWNLLATEEAKKTVRRTELEQQSERTRVIARVITAWGDLVSALQRVEILEISTRMAGELKVPVEARVEAGMAAQLEVLRVEEVEATRRADLASARFLADEARRELDLLMGRGPTAGSAMTAVRPVGPLLTDLLPARERDRSLQAASSGNYGLQILRTEVERRGLQNRAAKHALLPTLDLEASLALDGQGFTDAEVGADVFSGRHPDLLVGLTLEIPLPDLAAIHELEASGRDVEAAQALLDAARREVASSTESAWAKIASIDERLALAHTRIGLAERRVEAAFATWEVGRNSVKDVLDAQEELARARMDVADLESDRLSAQVELERQRGDLLAALEVRVR